MPSDFKARDKFCRRFVQRNDEHFFDSSVLFTDLARLSIDGTINIHNQHQWAEESLHSVIHLTPAATED
jgi:hypothetical protein